MARAQTELGLFHSKLVCFDVFTRLSFPQRIFNRKKSKKQWQIVYHNQAEKLSETLSYRFDKNGVLMQLTNTPGHSPLTFAKIPESNVVKNLLADCLTFELSQANGETQINGVTSPRRKTIMRNSQDQEFLPRAVSGIRDDLGSTFQSKNC